MDLACVTAAGRLHVFRPHKESYAEVVATDGVSCFSWSSTGRSVALGEGEGGAVGVLAFSGKRMLHLERAARDGISSLLFGLPNHLLVGSGEGLVRIWQVQSGKPPQLVAGLEGHSDAVTCMAANRSVSLLASGSNSGDILLHDLQHEGFPVVTLCQGDLNDSMPVNKMAFRPKEANLLGSVTDGGLFRIWDVNRINPVQAQRSHEGPCLDLAFEEGGSVAVTVGLDGYVFVHDLRAKGTGSQLQLQSSPLCVDFDGKGKLAIGADDGCVHFFDLRNFTLKALNSLSVSVEGEPIQQLRFAPNPPDGSQRVFSLPSVQAAVLEKFALTGGATSSFEELGGGGGEEELGTERQQSSPRTPPAAVAALFSPTRGAELTSSAAAALQTSVAGRASISTQGVGPSPAFSAALTDLRTPGPGPAAVVSQSGARSSALPWEGSTSKEVRFEGFELTPVQQPSQAHQKKHEQLLQKMQMTPASAVQSTPVFRVQHAHEEKEDTSRHVGDQVLGPISALDSDAVMDLKLQMHRSVRSMHVDMIRSFYFQQAQTQELMAKIDNLAAENERLRNQLK